MEKLLEEKNEVIKKKTRIIELLERKIVQMEKEANLVVRQGALTEKVSLQLLWATQGY